MALSTTIQLLQDRDRARDEREGRLDPARMVENWRHDISEVYDTIRAALKGYEADGVAAFGVEEVEVSEELLGVNTYERLTIEIIGRRIVVAPVARYIIGGTGRLDMYRANRPSEDHRVLIVRGALTPDDPPSWLIEQKGEALTRPPGPLNGYNRGRRRFKLLEPPAIESAVDYLLQLP